MKVGRMLGKTKSNFSKNYPFLILVFSLAGLFISSVVYVVGFGDNEFTGLKTVTKVIDGDTVIAEGESVRLLGIDADERGYPCYKEAKKRLEELILNKEVYLERNVVNKDQYGRYLRYIFLNGQNINLELVKEGLAIARFSPENVKYKEEIIAAEKDAREKGIGCKWEHL
jgi:micrococcal nuclease